MIAEILCVGTELLHGDIVNTNARYISKKLAEIAVDVHYQTVVGDNQVRIRQCLGVAFSRADIIICTGGLGPTQDDITKDVLAEFFNVEMVYDEESYQHIKKVYSRFRKDFPKNNLRQAYFPKGAVVLDNPNGTANACIMNGEIDGKSKIGILLPGPPKEMEPLVDNSVIPYLKQFSHEVVYGEKLVVVNIGESAAEEMILDLIEKQTNPTIAPYASAGKVIFRITAKAYVTENGMAEDKTAQLLLKENITVATAESLTGGLVASRLVSYPGISRVFKEGFVTYSNEAKINTLHVNRDTLSKYGAVSEETAKEMAYGAAQASGSDLGVSTTGIAGPDGGTEDKPVGLFYVCVYYKGGFSVKEVTSSGSREMIRDRAATMALDLVRRCIEDKQN